MDHCSQNMDSPLGTGYLERIAGENGNGESQTYDFSGGEDIVITQPAIKQGLLQLNQVSNAELKENDDDD